MHVRVRFAGKPECIVVVPSKLTKIEKFKELVYDKFGLDVALQRLFYGGKLLEDGYSFHDYNIKLNDVIQLMQKISTPIESPKNKTVKSKDNEVDNSIKISYKAAESKLYGIGDLVDVRERVHKAWFEGKVVGVFEDPDYIPSKSVLKQEVDSTGNEDGSDNDSKSKSSPIKETNGEADTSKSKLTPKRGIKDYFSKGGIKQKSESNGSTESHPNGHPSPTTDDLDEVGLLYKVQFDDEDDESSQYCKATEIRPRSRRTLDVDNVTVNQTVMLNYNTEDPNELGYWYDFTIHEIKKNRRNVELIGTLYHGEDVPLHDIRVTRLEKLYAIETVVPLKKRTPSEDEIMTTATEKRAGPLNCLKCRDKPNTLCKDCGCGLCAGKNQPELIILCDECNQGYHMSCLIPPLEKIPEDDWYCSDCKRDTNEVVAPGAKKQQRKPNQGQKSRDWGRGMACVGKTQTCAMPANHFGPIPGIEVGMMWRFRIQLSESGVHRPPVSGIHGRDVEGAYSIVLSGGYEDDYDDGYEFTYTGSGGRDLSGNKRTADQSSDQTLTRENKALARNCAVKVICEDGADSKDNWKEGKPVRVVRSYKMLKHFPQYAPKEGIRYDGIYKVVKYYPETGKSGFRVWKYLLRRDDPSPAPWEEGAKDFPIIYPDGYLEAEAEKQAQKEKDKLKKTPGKGRKRPLRESNENEKEGQGDAGNVADKKSETPAPPAKKMRTRSSITEEEVEEENTKTPKRKKAAEKRDKILSPPSVNPFTLAAKKSKSAASTPLTNGCDVLSSDDEDLIKRDSLNRKIWEECLAQLQSEGKKGLVDKVTELFLCIICQEVAANPVTTTCSHNFCLPCLKLAFKSTETSNCPYCRSNLSKDELEPNQNLKAALQIVLPGYDLNRK